MTGSSSDTAVFTAGTNGTLSIVTTDAAAAAANIQITADGTAELAGTTVTLDSSAGITLDADNGTITFADAGVSLGTITSSGYTGNVVGDVTGSGAGLTAGTTPLTTLDIDGGTELGEAIVNADLLIIDNGAGGTNRKLLASRLPTYLFGNTATLAVGYSATPDNAGTKSSGTYTPDEADGGLAYAVNGGAHTLAPPSNNCTIIIQYTNDGSAGTITTSGFTYVTGDTISTTNGDDFFFYVIKNNGFSQLHVTALQ
jgi:hypothetical protein